MATFSFYSDSGDLVGSLQGERERAGLGAVSSLRRGDAERGANESRGGGSGGLWGFIPRDGLGSSWIVLDAIGQGNGALRAALWSGSNGSNESVGGVLLRSQFARVQWTFTVCFARLWCVGARACKERVARCCTHGAVHTRVRHEAKACVHGLEWAFCSRCPQWARGAVRARLRGWPTGGVGGGHALGVGGGAQGELSARRQRIAWLLCLCLS
jgi:hypothetical protein